MHVVHVKHSCCHLFCTYVHFRMKQEVMPKRSRIYRCDEHNEICVLLAMLMTTCVLEGLLQILILWKVLCWTSLDHEHIYVLVFQAKCDGLQQERAALQKEYQHALEENEARMQHEQILRKQMNVSLACSYPCHCRPVVIDVRTCMCKLTYLCACVRACVHWYVCIHA